jgi:hypothetical protein
VHRELPHSAAIVIDRFVRRIDHTDPGLVEAVWIEGSIALGDYQSTSDVDVVVLCTRAAPASWIRATRSSKWTRLHATWVTREDLAALGSGLGAVMLAVLHRHGIAVRGPEPSGLVPDVPHVRLAAVCKENAATYWARWHADASRAVPGIVTSLHPRLIVWGTSGIARQLVTISEGGIVSKADGLRWARAHFEPRWHRILDESLRLRTGIGRRRFISPFERRREMLDFVAEALRRVTR